MEQVCSRGLRHYESVSRWGFAIVWLRGDDNAAGAAGFMVLMLFLEKKAGSKHADQYNAGGSRPESLGLAWNGAACACKTCGII